MEQFDSSVEESSKVTEQQQRNDEQQCPSCAAELGHLWSAMFPRSKSGHQSCGCWQSIVLLAKLLTR